MLKHKYIYFLAGLILSCSPQSEDDIILGPLPQNPDFSVTYVPEDSNRIIVSDLTSDNFIRLWDAPSGNPAKFNISSDTIYYAKAGDYDITLHIAQAGGNGTATTTKTVHIPKDAVSPCSGPISLLTGECGAAGKCWKFSNVAGAITVGPTAGSGEWYRSPANGLVPSQYDDRFCFNFDGTVYDYQNQGFTVNPFAGYADEAYTPVAGPWIFSPGTGLNGVPQLILTHGQFIGTRDSYSVLDIVTLTETEMVVRAPFADQSGNNTNAGWFEFKLVAE